MHVIYAGNDYSGMNLQYKHWNMKHNMPSMVLGDQNLTWVDSLKKDTIRENT